MSAIWPRLQPPGPSASRLTDRHAGLPVRLRVTSLNMASCTKGHRVRNIIVNISPPKCGTTSLYFAIAASRGVAGSVLKEPRFFAGPADDDQRELPDAMRTGGHFLNGTAWHDSLFEGEREERYRIDFTTYYAVTSDTPELLKSLYPDARLMMVLRDPVARFVSQYYQYTKMAIRVPSIEDVVRSDGPVSNLLYRFADYRATYERFACVFGEDAILVLDFRDLKRDAESVSRACNAFLDLDDIEYAPTEREKNVAGQPRYQVVQRAMFSDGVRRLARRVSPALKTRLLRLRKKVILANVKAEAYPPLAPELEQLLTERLSTAIEFYESRCGTSADVSA